ncbi:MAG: class I SAM-dependent methyltransferase [bacterium]
MNRPLFLSRALEMVYKIRKGCRNDYYCPVCESSLAHFNRFPDNYFEMLDKYGCIHSLFRMETLNYLKYSCPVCGTSDRSRLYAVYLRDKLCSPGYMNKPIEFLEIAPDRPLSCWLKKVPAVHYRSMDLYMAGADDKADIVDMKIYGDNKFDAILCSHVLEHVEDDIKAMSELHRILKTGGFAIVMVPILLALDGDLYNSNRVSEGDRWKYYGQGDHVRMYSKKGFVSKLEQCGFRVAQFGVDHFGAEVFTKHGIHERSVLYVVEK